MGKPGLLFYDTETGFYDFKNEGSLHLEIPSDPTLSL
jgi:hypothetical protein